MVSWRERSREPETNGATELRGVDHPPLLENHQATLLDESHRRLPDWRHERSPLVFVSGAGSGHLRWADGGTGRPSREVLENLGLERGDGRSLDWKIQHSTRKPWTETVMVKSQKEMVVEESRPASPPSA